MATHKKAAGAPVWMVTFADMMSLLVALFVLLLSFSVMDTERYKKIAGSMQESFGLQHIMRMGGMIEIDGNPVREHMRDIRPVPVVELEFSAETLPETADREMSEIPDRTGPESSEPARPKHPMLTKLNHQFADEMADSLLSIGESNGRIVLSFPDSVAFPSGSAVLSNSFHRMLDKLSATLEQTEGEILVAGHTDPTPIATQRFRSNWDLSTARAVSVIHYWLNNSLLSVARLTAQGHADSRPVTTNDTSRNRAANRRVEISITAQ